MRLRPREIHLFLLGIDIILLNLCFFLVRIFCRTGGDAEGSNRLLLILNSAYIIVSPVFINNLRDLKLNVLKMIKTLVRRFVYYFAFIFLIIILLEYNDVPPRQLLVTIGFFFLLKLAISLCFFYFYFFKTHLYLKPALIIGSNKVGRELQSYFSRNKYLGIRPVGILAEKPDFFPDKNIVGSVDDFQSIFDRSPFEDAFIAVPLSQEELISRLIALSEKNGVRTHVVPTYSGNYERHFKVSHLGDIPLLQLRNLPLDNYSNRFWKRAFDIAFSILMILILLPVGLLIAIGIKLTSKGPAIFRTRRLGVTGSPFEVYKFRTMEWNGTAGAESRSTVPNDQRITAFGRILRKCSLDELPQFFNVLANDMSVVGPRPHRIYLNQNLKGKMSSYMIRHLIKPGITGWAQVNGWRGPTDTKLQYWGRTLHDLWYMEHWNFWLDIYIIFLTVFGKKVMLNAF
jgi:putative colanic acid biosynthesis UDP-glucose lipid carrier transferase